MIDDASVADDAGTADVPGADGIDSDRRRWRRYAAPAEERPPIELTEAALEALLFVAERPLSRREIAQLAGTDRTTVDERLGDLEVSLRARGVRLLVDGERVELATAPEGGALVARYVGADAIRLSPASLETLAIIAYRQPVTKAAIERIRGVDSDYTVRTLLHRRLVVELGRSDAPGRPFLYGTGLRVPRAVRPDQPGRAAAARRGCRGPARGGGRRTADGGPLRRWRAASREIAQPPDPEA